MSMGAHSCMSRTEMDQVLDEIVAIITSSQYPDCVRQVLADDLYFIIEISTRLFPHSHVLRYKIRREAESFAQSLHEDIVGIHKCVSRRLARCEDIATGMAKREKDGTASMEQWTQIMKYV